MQISGEKRRAASERQGAKDGQSCSCDSIGNPGDFNTQPPLAYSAHDAARMLGISVETLDALTVQERVRGVLVRGCMVYRHEALADFLREQEARQRIAEIRRDRIAKYVRGEVGR